ncbi:hypothetical protein JOC27_002616 [Sporolactobacillus spathodeae]|uniref:Uncharacterized protein n=1 Tax=Sporolactobacillus spathodeae TaxID=1465502 RepID=A0ABS2QBC5_9BACL|nr:hypothetical protein [Sporolactobacillus spathodeae]
MPSFSDTHNTKSLYLLKTDKKERLKAEQSAFETSSKLYRYLSYQTFVFIQKLIQCAACVLYFRRG